jgi:hypothetical protein
MAETARVAGSFGSILYSLLRRSNRSPMNIRKDFQVPAQGLSFWANCDMML